MRSPNANGAYREAGHPLLGCETLDYREAKHLVQGSETFRSALVQGNEPHFGDSTSRIDWTIGASYSE